MIASVSGVITEVTDDRLFLRVGPLTLELLVPASALDTFRSATGTQVDLYTLLYLEGDSSGGNSEPRLLGFRSVNEKKFFEKFITVKGIGPRKALRALTTSYGDVADAIESKDPKRLAGLPGIGKRTAEQIIAELSGKVQEFVTPRGVRGAGISMKPTAPSRPPVEEDAILSLMALGERRGDAELLLERARSAEPEAMGKLDTLVRVMLRLRGG
jgi:Holliday junction DNA helicase RuvA